MVRPAISEIKKSLLLLVVIWLTPLLMLAQGRTWGFSLSPGFGKAKEVISVTYNSGFFVDLTINEPTQFDYTAEVHLEKVNSKKWVSYKSIGYSSYKYLMEFNYNHEASSANILSDEYKFGFAYFSYRFGKEFAFKKNSISPYLGLTLNYAISAKRIYTSVYGTNTYNQLDDIEKFNYGWETGFNLNIPVEKIILNIRPSFTQLWKTYHNGERRIFQFGLGLGCSFPVKKKS